MDQVLAWPSGHMNLAIGRGVVMLQVITGVNVPAPLETSYS